MSLQVDRLLRTRGMPVGVLAMPTSRGFSPRLPPPSLLLASLGRQAKVHLTTTCSLGIQACEAAGLTEGTWAGWQVELPREKPEAQP